MMPFVINFDVPELEGEPLWAGWVNDHGMTTLGWAPTLATAARFDTEEIAERHLASYSPWMQECGEVVEVFA